MKELNKDLNAEAIRGMCYPDFVALMQQDNTPPGGDYTIDFWVENAAISGDSYLLDLACSTGYSSRECFLKTGSRAQGIDISASAISIANEKALALKAEDKLKYLTADACALPFEESIFTHALGGCNFAFIQDREDALEQVYNCLRPQGILCIANFYYKDKIPDTLISEVFEAISFRPNPEWTLSFWSNFFNKHFTLIKEETHEMVSQSYEELHADIHDYIFNRNVFTRSLSSELKSVIFEKFLKIRKPLNQQRNYQGVALQLWCKK